MFPVDDILLGPDSFGRLHRLDMLIGHTGEEPGFSRDYAVKTTIWQRTNPGSYSFRIYDSTSAGSKGGILLTVPYLEASGGINPSSTYWAPERFPFLAAELAKAGPCPVPGCPGPYRNPTMHAGQISFTGRTADLETKAPANYVPDANRLIEWYDGLSIRGPAPLVLVMHAHWQRNRSDWGAWMHAQLTEDEMTWINNVRWYKSPVLVTFRPGTTYRLTPDLNETDKYVAGGEEQRTVIGEVDGLDFGAGPLWLVIPGDGGVAKVAHSQDETARAPLGIVDPAALSALQAKLALVREAGVAVQQAGERIVQVAS